MSTESISADNIRDEKWERFTEELSRWIRQLQIWRGQLAAFPDDTPDGNLLRLMIGDGEAWCRHYETCLFDLDMAQLAHMGRRLWIAARNTDGHPKPEMPDDDLLCDFIPGADSELGMAEAVDEFARIADEIALIA